MFLFNQRLVKAVLGCVAAVFLVSGSTVQAQSYRVPRPIDGSWGAEFVGVPQLLRMHLPKLAHDHGLLVASVEPQSPAAQLGLHSGDVLLSINGAPVTSATELPPLTESTSAVSLHRGQIYNIRLPIRCILPFRGFREAVQQVDDTVAIIEQSIGYSALPDEFKLRVLQSLRH